MPCPFGFHAAAEDDCDDVAEEQQQTDKKKQDASKQGGFPFSVSCWLQMTEQRTLGVPEQHQYHR
jgi:hypothetical protein